MRERTGPAAPLAPGAARPGTAPQAQGLARGWAPLEISHLGREALDRPGAPAAVVRATLQDIARLNTLLGGRAAAWFGLAWLLEQERRERGSEVARGRRLSLLDVGAGSGDIARYLAHRARGRGVELAPVALERHPLAAQLCRAAQLPAVVADAGQVPLADRAVDVVLASQVLHHLEPASAVRLLGELDRAARLGVVVADLRRARLAAAGVWIAAHLLGLHPVTRKDAVTSVRRGFTVPELAALLAAAGVAGRVHRRPGYRLVAVWRTSGADG